MIRRMLTALLCAVSAHAAAEGLPEARDLVTAGLGVEHTCALDRQGNALCWGGNEFGQLGSLEGPLSARTTPVPVAGAGPGLKALAVGGFHACAVTASDGVACWGRDLEGALGDGPGDGGPAPVTLAGLQSVKAVAAGAVHGCALRIDGSVACWGANGQGQLGRDSRVDGDAPGAVVGLGGAATAIDAGDEHTCAIVAAQVRCWGDNDFGQLGDGSTTDRLAPVTVQGLTGTPVAIAAGARATCALNDAGTLFCWGPQYPLAAFDGGSLVARPYPLSQQSWTGVDAGDAHFCVWREAGPAECFGDDADGQLGRGPRGAEPSDPFVRDLPTPGLRVFAGGRHACAIGGSDGRMRCWGLNTKGQLGTDTITRRLVPSVPLALDEATAEVAAGGFHGCARSGGGGVRCWGANHQDTLGDGTQVPRLMPVDVVGLQAGTRALAVGVDHSCVITAARRVQCWGANFDGRLGNGGNLNSGVPVDVQGLGNVDVLAITLGEAHACALLQGGAVKCWGDNGDGQVGDGSNVDRPLPVDVAGLSSGVTAIVAGYRHTCAIANGALRCWGANGNGQLGDGTTVDRNAPVATTGLASGVQAVAAAEFHTCAVVAGGAVRCWGASFFGRLLGDESGEDRLVPGEVPALRGGVTAIAAGGFATCVIIDGGLHCWGAHPIGDNTELARGLPTPVSGMEHGVTAVDAGFGGQLCAVQDGYVKCWAENGFGQVGDGTTHGQPQPAAVRIDAAARRVGALEPEADAAATNARSDASGRYVVFESRAGNLVPGDTGGTLDVFRTDRETGQTVRVSVDDGEAPIAGDSSAPAISADGQLVVFVAADAAVGKARHRDAAMAKGTNWGVYLRNLVTGTTSRVGTATGGGAGTAPRLAPNGAAVAFTSDKTPAGAATRPNVYVVPIANGTPGPARCASCKVVNADGSEGEDADGQSRNAVLSGDATRVAFESTAKNALAASPSPCAGGADVFLRNLVTGAMQRMAPPPATPAGDCGTAGSTQPSLDHAGDTLAFQSDQRLDPRDGNGTDDVYVVQVGGAAGVTLVSDAPDGVAGDAASRRPELSGDGLSLAFESEARNLDLRFADNNERADVHVADLADGGALARLSRGSGGAEADAASERPTLNHDGTKVSFDSAARTLIGLAAGRAAVYQRANPLATPVKSATWWRPSESGWGLTIFDQGNLLAPAWFTYDSDGEPTWFLTAGAFPANGDPDAWSGQLLRLTGTPFDRIEGPAVTSSTPVGRMDLRILGEGALAMDYTVDGVRRAKVLQPFAYGTRTFACTGSPGAARDAARNYSDLWTGAGGNAGWGLTVFHVDDAVYAGWYTYDTDGEAVFFVLATSRQADGSYRGPIFRQRNGVPFTQIADAPASGGTDTVGQATLRFADGDTGTFEYSVGTVAQSKPIVRLLVGSRPSTCQTEDARR